MIYANPTGKAGRAGFPVKATDDTKKTKRQHRRTPLPVVVVVVVVVGLGIFFLFFFLRGKQGAAEVFRSVRSLGDLHFEKKKMSI